MEKSAIVISIYSTKGTAYDKTVGGAAHYIKQILLALKDWQFTVLAETRNKGQREEYSENNTNILRCWNSASFFYWITICKEIIKSQSKVVIVNFEFNVFGGKINAGLFMFVILFCFFTGKKIVFIQHQVVNSIIDLQQHLNLSSNKVWLFILDSVMKLYMALCFAFSSKVIVFEQVLKERASRLLLVHKHKIEVIPHPIYSDHEASVQSRLSDPEYFNLVYFGFVTWYKGADWLVEKTLDAQWDSDVKVTIAGGESVTAPNKSYFEHFKDLVEKSKATKYLGYIEEKDVPHRIQESDLLILPYRVLMSSSGPLATALGYKKPFIMSKNLVRYTETQDFQEALATCGLQLQDFIFSLEDDSLFTLLRNLKAKSDTYNKLIKFVQFLGEKRSVSSIASQYQSVLGAFIDAK